MLQIIHPTTWTEVFEDWRDREGDNPDWIRTATEIKGWPNWESWRMFTATQLKLPERDWLFAACTEPISDVPNFLVGPYSGWQSFFSIPNRNTFADLVRLSQHADRVRIITQRLVNNFPQMTRLIGLRKPDGTIVLVEGHHRAAAIAWSVQYSHPISLGVVNISIADIGFKEQDLFDTVLARGSTRVPENTKNT